MKVAIAFGKFILGIGVALGILAFCIGVPQTAAFASTAFTVVGQGTGVAVGSLNKFAEGVKDGRDAVQPAQADADPGTN